PDQIQLPSKHKSSALNQARANPIRPVARAEYSLCRERPTDLTTKRQGPVPALLPPAKATHSQSATAAQPASGWRQARNEWPFPCAASSRAPAADWLRWRRQSGVHSRRRLTRSIERDECHPPKLPVLARRC